MEEEERRKRRKEAKAEKDLRDADLVEERRRLLRKMTKDVLSLARCSQQGGC